MVPKHIGVYETAKEAAIARDRAVLKSNQFKSFLNFPDMVHNLDVEPKRKKQKVRSISGYRGVTKNNPGKNFRAQIRIGGKMKGFGTFDTKLAAGLAYDRAAIKNGNELHTLNFPTGLKVRKPLDPNREMSI